MKSVFKWSKRFLALIAISICIWGICACSSNKNDGLEQDYMDYYSDKIDGRVFTTSQGTEIVVCALDKQDVYAPRVILSVFIGNTDTQAKTYDWISLSADERKDDLRECGDMVVEYAKAKKWSNNYYLYITVKEIYGDCQVVYDYESDTIWIPNAEPIYEEMYEKFGTFLEKTVAETQDGIDFLISNNLAYMKHNEVEFKKISSYDVYVHEDKFSSYDKDQSTAY